MNNLKLKINPATVINKKMTVNILYPNLTNQYFILLKKVTFLLDLIGRLTKVFSIIKSNKLQMKPAKLGIKYTSSMVYPIFSKEEQNIARQVKPINTTIGLNQWTLEDINESVSSIVT
jgi:hypothetical protein